VLPRIATGQSLRQAKIARWGALQSERAPWISRYSEITQYVLPFAGRYFAQDRNKPKSFNSIYDSTATEALDILAAGMMAGMTSPARPWFRLAVGDPQLMESEGVKIWLNDVAQLMRAIFAKSNTYRALHSMYEELGAFNTAVTLVDPNFDTVIWNHPLTAGEYAIACDKLGRVDTVYREFEMTIAQVVEDFVYDEHTGAFDWTKVTPSVKNMWDNGKSFDQWIPVLHGIEPRRIADRSSDAYQQLLAKNMRWASCYVELGQSKDDVVLRESGYQEAPFIAPRWHTRGRDIYGHGPGMKALGDIKQLQHEQLRKGQAIDFMTLPPIGLPGSAKGREVDRLPGGVTHLGADSAGNGSKGRNLFDVNLNLQHLLEDVKDVRGRIRARFYADLFLMLANDTREQPPTAREIAERHEEKLLMIGPVLERLHDEMLTPLIDITFARIVMTGIMPQPPQELQGADLKIEFVSTLAQAQKAVGLASFDRLLGTVALVSQSKQDPGVWDKIDTDEVIDKYADMLAIDPSVLLADDKIAIIRDQRAKQQAAAQLAATAPAMAKAGKDMSETSTAPGDQNALADLTHQFQGYN
jgi:hypothetical protein